MPGDNDVVLIYDYVLVIAIVLDTLLYLFNGKGIFPGVSPIRLYQRDID